MWDEVLRHLTNPSERERPLTDDDAAYLLTMIERHFPESFISGYESLIPLMSNDHKDRHVAAVAVHASAQVIVTYNLKHFPATALASYGIEAQHPDAFLMGLYDIEPRTMVRVISQQAAALKKRPTSARQILDKLAQVGATQFAQAVRTRIDEEDGLSREV